MSVSHDHAADSTTVVTDYTAILAYLEGEHYRWNATDDLGVPVFVTYTFLSNDDLPTLEEYDPYDADGYYAYSSKQKANFRLALEEFEEHSGVVFVEVDDPDIAMIEAFGASGTEWAGWAYYPYVTTEDTYSSAIVIDYNDSFAPGLASYSTVIHEIGHALGLSHPHEGDILLDPSLDYKSNTIMSYEWGYPYEEVLGYLDVEALQHIYGEAPNMDGVTYRVNAENAFVVRGSDRADIFFGIDGENKIFGYDGDDYLIGREHNDEIYGGKGKDLITGGEGRDYLIGGEGKDSLIGGDNADQLVGGKGWDVLFGRQGKDILSGGNGADTLEGGGGADDLTGGKGNDYLSGGKGNDILTGGRGNDVLNGGGGGDVLVGGKGEDIFVFDVSDSSNIDTISDFNFRKDTIDLSAFNVGWDSLILDERATYFQLLQVNGNQEWLTIYIATGDTRDFTEDNFIF